MKVKSLSRVRLLATPWTAACQAPLSVGFSRQEYWSGVPLPFPQLLNCVQLFVTLWTVARQAPSSMGFSGQEYWSGVPFLPLRDLPDPGMEAKCPASLALAGGFFTAEPPGKPSKYTDNLC